MSIIRQSSSLQAFLGPSAVNFVEYAADSIRRLLPHVEVSSWSEGSWESAGCTWTSTGRREFRLTIAIGERDEIHSRSLVANVKRRNIPGASSVASEIIDSREHDICNLIVRRISHVLSSSSAISQDDVSLKAILAEFDEYVVAAHIQKHHDLKLPVSEVLGALHKLSEQSYENKALTFGCVLDPGNRQIVEDVTFPEDYLSSKRYKALSDGFRTAYLISTYGQVVDFIDLDRYGKMKLSERNHFPDWAEPMARMSRGGRCGIALSRQGDILVFDEGTLRFTYRYGQWQYWNHTHLIKLLRDRAKAQGVQKKVLGRVVGAIYRAALDVSFRRSGGLFVVLHHRHSLHEIVRQGDAVTDGSRRGTDASFDAVFSGKKIQFTSRSILVELASLDGAVVLENSGKIVAYGAVLRPKKSGKLIGAEGSRTKAAIGASNYGLAVKISSDGDISVFHEGKTFIRV